MIIEWLDPWYGLGPDYASQARALECELSRELRSGHVLSGLDFEAVGKRGDRDDALFRLNDGSGRLALVHLTWSGKQEHPPWPSTLLFASVQDWIERGLLPDHTEYVSGELTD
jgi:hypothetical protein